MGNAALINIDGWMGGEGMLSRVLSYGTPKSPLVTPLHTHAWSSTSPGPKQCSSLQAPPSLPFYSAAALLLMLVASVVSDSVRPHRWQPTSLRRPWDSPGKNTGVGCQSCSNAWKWKVKVKLLSCVWLLAIPWTAAYQGAGWTKRIITTIRFRIFPQSKAWKVLRKHMRKSATITGNQKQKNVVQRNVGS